MHCCFNLILQSIFLMMELHGPKHVEKFFVKLNCDKDAFIWFLIVIFVSQCAV